jgi:hypothetical protein
MFFCKIYLMYFPKLARCMTHSQLLEGLKCESETEDNERIKSWGTLPGSQHYSEVEGRAGAPGWD